jgi:sulfite reductase (NADPH) hemoprotein beta-component
MDDIADIAERYAFDELRVTHEQNLVLPHVAIADLRAVYEALVATGFADGNSGLITDMICCPGLDFCALANARSIPIAQEISRKFAEPARQAEIGDLKIKKFCQEVYARIIDPTALSLDQHQQRYQR